MATPLHTISSRLIFKEYLKGRSLTFPIFKKNGTTFKCLQALFKTVKGDAATTDIPLCNHEEFDSFQKLLDHLNNDHWIRILEKQNNYCLTCEVIFEIKWKAKNHRQSECLENRHTCRICRRKRYRTYRGLAFHWSNHHKTEVIAKKTDIRCFICNKLFATKVIEKITVKFR
jgi:hypothetical protein